MFADKLIIQVLEKNGELETTIMHDSCSKPLLVDYPTFGRERKKSELAVSILSDHQSNLKETKYIKNNLDKSPYFKRLSDGTIEFHQKWVNIPIQGSGSMGLYCLIFPEYATLTNLKLDTNIKDLNLNNEKVLLKDPDFNRYLLYLQLKCSESHCSFNIDIQAKFSVDEKVFLNTTFEPSGINFICDQSSNFGKNEQNSDEIREFKKIFKALAESSHNPSLNIVLQMAIANLEVENLYLAEAAEIQRLLQQLSQSYPTQVSSETKQEIEVAVREISQNPTLRHRVIGALRSGSMEALRELADNPYVNILLAAWEGWQEG